MKHLSKIFPPLFIFLLFFSGTIFSQYKKTDSTRIVHRIEKYPCPAENAVIETAASPLPQYSFYSRLFAVSTTLDSAGNVKFKTEYIYYFDDSSYYVALKQTDYNYESGNVQTSSFVINEIQDSISFELDLSLLNRKPKYKTLRNCEGQVNIYKAAKMVEGKNYTRTGKTMVINGYTCNEYVWDNESNRNTYWVANSEEAWFSKSLVDLNSFSTFPAFLHFGSGMVMRSEMYYKKTKLTQKFEVTQIDKKHFYRITSDGYVLNLR